MAFPELELEVDGWEYQVEGTVPAKASWGWNLVGPTGGMARVARDEHVGGEGRGSGRKGGPGHPKPTVPACRGHHPPLPSPAACLLVSRLGSFLKYSFPPPPQPCSCPSYLSPPACLAHNKLKKKKPPAISIQCFSLPHCPCTCSSL